ncbi:MAG: TetR/AcrR family transcriptional regulator [Gammaproteobacteria bacterium]|nr:TetR/AcrR family transcriptional regulator [Gammaproteobacteria bacterium]
MNTERFAIQKSSMTGQLQRSPKHRTGGRSSRIAQDVIAATQELLMEGTLRDFTFENVARRAGVNRVTLHRRWGNKWRLLTWVLAETMAFQVPPPDTGSLREDLLETLLGLNRVVALSASAAIFQVLFIESRYDETIRNVVRDYWATRKELVELIVTHAIEKNELSPNVNTEFFIDIVFGPFFYRVLRTGQPISERYAETLIDASLTCLSRLDESFHESMESQT